MRIVPSAATASNLGFALARAGDFQGAIEAYREAARLDPTRPRTLARLGEALDHEGRTGEAIEAYEASLRLDPAQAGIRSNLGVCLASMGRTDEAIAQYTEALRLAPGAPEVLNNLGAALESAARPGEALERYREAVRLRPDFADARLNLANLLLRSGRAGGRGGASTGPFCACGRATGASRRRSRGPWPPGDGERAGGGREPGPGAVGGITEPWRDGTSRFRPPTRARRWRASFTTASRFPTRWRRA